MLKSKILIIEDNADTRKFLESVLSNEFEPIGAENGIIGLEHARKFKPDLILLDIMLPILSGYDVCKLLKKDERTSQIPIIFLSAKNTVQNITEGLSFGAEDYVSKPFDYKELIARIQVRLRKSQSEIKEAIIVGDLKISILQRVVTFENQKIHLTFTEFDILKLLASKSGTIVSREEILQQVWKDTTKQTNDRTIDVHIRALRRKLAAFSRHIVSIYGVDYKYEP